MMTHRTVGWIAGLIVLLGSGPLGWNRSRAAADDPPPTPNQEQIEVLTRGPVHEAFAEPVTLEVQAGLIVPNQPPANIEEIPPVDRPAGDHFVWVPGYWSWDSDRSDYIWVSACWRVGPPNTYWVPGYWAPVADAAEVRRAGVHVSVGGLSVNVGGGQASPTQAAGWEWVSGFWASNDAQEIEYLPPPPAPMDLEPPGPPPSADNRGVPGCWDWQHEQYVRRPGYWLEQRDNWVWEPAHYRWTPRGYVFESGHWDYSLDRRGVLFAPAYIPRSVYGQAGYSYSPSIALDLGVLSVNLFTYPRYGHYYFGDYYDDAYLSMGIYPRFESDRRHTWSDPIYTYDRWHNGRDDKRWDQDQRQAYDQRRSHKDLRPARTYREMESRVAKMPEAQRRSYELAKPVQTIAAVKGSALKFERIDTAARQKISKQAVDAHKFRDERSKWESTGSTNPKALKPAADKAASLTERKDGKSKAPVAATPRDTPDVVAPREVNRDKPERVKLPVAPPIVGKQPAGDKGTPDRPVHEQKFQTDNKDSSKTDAKDSGKADAKDSHKADAKDSSKSDAKDSGKADAKDSGKADAKDSGKADAKDSHKADAKDSSKSDAKDSGKDEGDRKNK
ncbi:MAG: hypothetical protein NTV86_08740 [Planctomycetota bacterium]|nr:hypothetical protein [Planctomycetota bacterium]